MWTRTASCLALGLGLLLAGAAPAGAAPSGEPARVQPGSAPTPTHTPGPAPTTKPVAKKTVKKTPPAAARDGRTPRENPPAPLPAPDRQ